MAASVARDRSAHFLKARDLSQSWQFEADALWRGLDLDPAPVLQLETAGSSRDDRGDEPPCQRRAGRRLRL
eukprot:5091935-Alexandrium_andersonii.AAC.1